MNRTILSILCLISPFTFAEEAAVPPPAEIQTPPKPNADTAQKVLEASEAIGVLMAKSIQSLDINYNADKIVQGLKDALQGREKLKTEVECMEVVAHAQEAIFKEMAAENLKRTEEFLAKNKSADGVKELEVNKLQYKVEKEGSGPAVEEKSTPIVRYTAKFLDESADNIAKEESRINLEEEQEIIIPGFKKALIGMKEGEKRTVYIHPDLGFPANHYTRHTNSLLTYEIEVLKANAPAQQPIDLPSSLTPQGKVNPEVAHPFVDQKVVR